MAQLVEVHTGGECPTMICMAASPSTAGGDDHPLAIELRRLTTSNPPADYVDAVFRAYIADTGRALSIPPTGEQRVEVRDWMFQVFIANPLLTVGYPQVRREFVHRDVAAKALSLQQAPCTQCRVIDPNGNPPYPVSFPIPVRPFSKQTGAGGLTEAVRSAVERSHLATTLEAWRDVAICATVIAVQGEKRNIIDVDNAAKAILDTLGKLVFPDDKMIQHLSVSRLAASNTTGYYLVYLRPVFHILDDVIDPNSHATIAGTIQSVE